MFRESAPQCIAYTLDKCPRRVLRVLICIRPIGSMLPVACAREVSQAAFLPSRMAFFRCSASCRSCSSSFIAPNAASSSPLEWHSSGAPPPAAVAPVRSSRPTQPLLFTRQALALPHRLLPAGYRLGAPTSTPAIPPALVFRPHLL